MIWPHALRSLSRPDLRRFFLGQGVSLLGSWMQPVAVGWLTWRLTHSPQILGLVTFLSQLPVFLLSFHAGALADRVPRKSLLLAANLVLLIQAALFAGVVLGGLVAPWQIFALALVQGLGSAFEFPARNALIADLAADQTPNAVALYATCVTVMRAVGPSIGGYVIAATSEGWVFALNALSFLPAVGVLLAIRVPPSKHAKGATPTEGILDFVRATPVLRAGICLFGAAALLSVSYATLLPVLASSNLEGGAALLGRLLACTGAGAVLGSVTQLMSKARRDRRMTTSGHRATDGERRSGVIDRRAGNLDHRLGLGGLGLGLGVLALALSESTWISAAALVLAGFGQVTQTLATLTLLQGMVPFRLRGRAMGLFTAFFLGVPPFGALAMGWAATRVGVLPTLAASGAATSALSLIYEVHRRTRPKASCGQSRA